MANFPEPEPFVDERPSQSSAKRFPDDILLRRHRWYIVARLKSGLALWERNGVILPFHEAIEVVRTEVLAKKVMVAE